MKSDSFIFLASGSPRRRELLRQIGVSFRLIGADVDETARPGEPPSAYVARLAQAKAGLGWERSGDSGGVPVLAADTAVALDGSILGKPTGSDDAIAILQQLSGRTHEVLTAVALQTTAGAQVKIGRASWRERV